MFFCLLLNLLHKLYCKLVFIETWDEAFSGLILEIEEITPEVNTSVPPEFRPWENETCFDIPDDLSERLVCKDL